MTGRILSKKIFDSEGRELGIVLFEEGNWRLPLCILQSEDLAELIEECHVRRKAHH